VFSARTLIQEVSLEVILKVVFGIHRERFRKLKTLIVQLTDALQSPAIAGLVFFPPGKKIWDRGVRILALQRQMRELLSTEICNRRKHKGVTGSDI